MLSSVQNEEVDSSQTNSARSRLKWAASLWPTNTENLCPDAITDRALAALRRFLHRLGRETDQGEVGLVIDGHYLGISQFDSEASR